MLHFITALRCEADPLIRHYGMKAAGNHGQIPLYISDLANLAISGIGALQSAIATTTLAASGKAGPWINVGIAGHRSADIGKLLIAHKLSSSEGKSDYFPQLPIKTDITGTPLITSRRPCLDYPQEAAFDMEGYGFYRAALHFSSLDATHCLKVVSDNRKSPAAKFDKNWVSDLIERQIDSIAKFARQLNDSLSLTQTDKDRQQELLAQFHFTETQKHQLSKRFQQLTALDALPSIDPAMFRTAKDLLAHLQETVDESAFQRIG